MATKLQNMANELNEDFRNKIIDFMLAKFDIEVENNFDIFSMRLITERVDGKKFTKIQHDLLMAFSEGYGQAMDLVRKAA